MKQSINKSIKIEVIIDDNELGKSAPFFYIYHNWHSDQPNSIHRGSCSDCNYGFGKRKDQDRGLHGVWIGPFDTPELAEQYIVDNSLDPHPRCGRCSP